MDNSDIQQSQKEVYPLTEDEEDVRVAKNFQNMSLNELRVHEKGILKMVEDERKQGRNNKLSTS